MSNTLNNLQFKYESCHTRQHLTGGPSSSDSLSLSPPSEAVAVAWPVLPPRTLAVAAADRVEAGPLAWDGDATGNGWPGLSSPDCTANIVVVKTRGK